MNAVKLITVDLNGILQDILIEAIGQHVGINLLANYKSIEELQNLDWSECPDIVLIGNNKADYSGFLYRCCRAKVVCIESDGRKVDLWELKPQRIALGEVSPEKLANYLVGR